MPTCAAMSAAAMSVRYLPRVAILGLEVKARRERRVAARPKYPRFSAASSCSLTVSLIMGMMLPRCDSALWPALIARAAAMANAARRRVVRMGKVFDFLLKGRTAMRAKGMMMMESTMGKWTRMACRMEGFWIAVMRSLSMVCCSVSFGYDGEIVFRYTVVLSVFFRVIACRLLGCDMVARISGGGVFCVV